MEKVTGEIIKAERLKQGLSQGELAQLVGVTQDSISLWELGKRLPDTRYIVLLCEALNISADYLLGITN